MSTRLWLTTILCITAFSMNVAFAVDGEDALDGDDDDRGFDTPEEKARKAKGENVNPELNKEFANIAVVAKLDAATQTKLLAIQKRKEKAGEDFDKKNTKSIQRSEKAAASETKTLKRTGTQSLKRIEVKRKQTLAKFDTEVHKLLTPQQKEALDGDTLWNSIRKHFEQFRFSEEQNK
jgi:hypothetical protein